jgi:hypothetical protein
MISSSPATIPSSSPQSTTAKPRNFGLVDFDLGSGRVVSSEPLGLPGEVASIDVDRSGRHVIIAAPANPNDQRSATVYVLRDGQPQRLPSPADCLQADW